ncbi:MAG: GDP-mannose 4,6-dehydratase, partial [Chloroflexota bacterium]|nr:GDP-mannose 4,6-dehydratase [Chloroflexota bacterium]
TNPYTGVAAIFCGRMLDNQPPLIYEDGQQTRDFVHVSDVVQACRLAMSSPAADYQVFNVGTGRPISVMEVAEVLARELGFSGPPRVVRQFRAGDIRHCFADVRRIHQTLGYTPSRAFEHGVRELVEWVREQRQLGRGAPDAHAQLAAHGLVR